jgi:hypothetical protein
MSELDKEFKLSEDLSTIEQKRPTFLLVLCILTFVGSGFGLIMGLINFTGFNDIESALSRGQAGNPFSKAMLADLDLVTMQKTQDWVNLLSLFASILCLAGAIIMFKMKKIGYVPYLVGNIVAIYGGVVSMSLVKEMSKAMSRIPMGNVGGDVMSAIGGGTLILTVVVAIAFLIMYGLNLKHLK